MVTTAVAVLHWNMNYSLVVPTTAIVVCPVKQTQQGVNHERHTGLVIDSQSGSETELFRQQAQTFICYATTQHHTVSCSYYTSVLTPAVKSLLTKGTPLYQTAETQTGL